MLKSNRSILSTTAASIVFCSMAMVGATAQGEVSYAPIIQQVEEQIGTADVAIMGEMHSHAEGRDFQLQLIEDLAAKHLIDTFGTEAIGGPVENAFLKLINDDKPATRSQVVTAMIEANVTALDVVTTADYVVALQRIRAKYGIKICGINVLEATESNSRTGRLKLAPPAVAAQIEKVSGRKITDIGRDAQTTFDREWIMGLRMSNCVSSTGHTLFQMGLGHVANPVSDLAQANTAKWITVSGYFGLLHPEKTVKAIMIGQMPNFEKAMRDRSTSGNATMDFNTFFDKASTPQVAPSPALEKLANWTAGSLSRYDVYILWPQIKFSSERYWTIQEMVDLAKQ